MVRIGIEASERISLACEAEGVAGPANVSAQRILADHEEKERGGEGGIARGGRRSSSASLRTVAAALQRPTRRCAGL
jgi:hypothetical protein